MLGRLRRRQTDHKNVLNDDSRSDHSSYPLTYDRVADNRQGIVREKRIYELRHSDGYRCAALLPLTDTAARFGHAVR